MHKFIILLLCAIFLGSGTSSAATLSLIGGGTTTVTRYPTFSALAVSSTDANLVYAYASYFTEGDIYRSTDAGISWSKFSSFPYVEFGVKKLVAGNSAGTLYVLTSYGLYATTDAGSSWSALLSAVETETLALDPGQGALLVGTNGLGILRSLDGGSTWSVISTGIPSVAVQSLYISSVVPADGSPRLLLAGTADGIYRSLDGGEAWSNTGDGLPAATSVKAIAASSEDVRVLYAASNKGIFKSSDSGETWTLFSSTVAAELTAISSGTADSVIAFVNSTLQKSQDGTLWSYLSSSSAFANAPPATLYSSSGSAGIDVSGNGGDSWSRSIAGLPSYTETVSYCTSNCKTEAVPSGMLVGVVSPAGSPVVGARVTCGTVTLLTDVNGNALFYQGTSGLSSCNAQISASGYLTTSATVASQLMNSITATQVTLSPNQLQVSATAGSNGTISPSSTSGAAGSSISLTVTPNTGYRIGSVSGCGGFLNGNVFKTAPLSSACTVQASFVAAPDFKVYPVSGGSGSISPSITQSLAGNSSTSFALTPAAGYQVMSVTGCGGTLSGNSYTTGPVQADCTVRATFGRPVSFVAGANGTITGSASQVVANGAATTAVTAVPGTGYDFVDWTGTGGFATTATNPLTVTNVTAAQTVTANFAIKRFAVTPAAVGNGTMTPDTVQTADYGTAASFTLTPQAGYQLVSATGCGGALNGNIYTTGPLQSDCTVSAAFDPRVVFGAGPNGTVQGNASQVISSGGSTAAVTATPNTGYKFVNWTGTGGFVTTTSNPLVVSNVTQAQNITANFAVQTFSVSLQASSGTISPSGPQTVNYNTTQSFTLVPNTGYAIQSASGCGGTLNGNVYTTAPVLADCTVSAVFGRPVTFVAGANGTVAGNSNQVVNDGADTTTVTALPATGYRFVNWTGTGGFATTTDNPLTLGSVISAQTITANFEVLKFSITAACSSDGAISPASSLVVDYGTTPTFTITPNEGYRILTPVGGSCPQGAVAENSYTTGPITGDCTIRASFSPQQPNPGDCDDSGNVSIAEVQTAINMYLGMNEVKSCVDLDKSGTAGIAEVQKSINSFLGLGSAASLVAINVQPSSASMALGGNQLFSARGVYSDSTTQDLTLLADWSSSATSVAGMGDSAGEARAAGVGNAEIKAKFGGITGAGNLTVTSASLRSISLQPSTASIPRGTTQKFTAIGSYSDNSTRDISALADWNIASGSVATVASGGMVTASGTGSTTITAALDGVSASASVSVAPPELMFITVTPGISTLALGISRQFTATGTYTDGSTQDLTVTATWSATPGSVATITSQGIANATALGDTTITASAGGFSGAAALTVTPAALVGIAVTPALPSIALGTGQQFSVLGTYTDNSMKDLTQTVAWSSSATSVASIGNSTGSAASVSTGSTVITATVGGIFGSTTLTVTPAVITAVSVSPSTKTIARGTSFQCNALGTFSDNTSRYVNSSVTWSSSSPGVASIGNASGNWGIATGLAVGTTTITAASGSVSNTSQLTVVDNLAGNWSGSWSSPPFGGCGAGSGALSFTMTQSGAQVSTNAFGLPWIGTVTASNAQMVVNCCNRQTSTWRVSGNTLTGTVPVVCGASEYMAPFTVTRP